MSSSKPQQKIPQSKVSGHRFPAISDPRANLQLALQYQLEKSQWWPVADLKSQQLKQLELTLRHAFTTVPYYQQLLAQHKLKLPMEITNDFIQQIPISTRAAIQTLEREFTSSHIPADHGQPEFDTTSGSTGRPIQFAKTALTHTFWLAFGMRDHLWHNRDFSTKLCAIRWFPRGKAEAPDGAHQPTWGSIVNGIFPSGPSATLNVITPLPEQIQWLVQEKPDYLVSLPSNLVALVKYAKSQNLSLPKLREIRTIGETVTEATRTLLQEQWQTKVVDIYTCEEAGYLALQCPQTSNYHVQSENIMLEIVDKDGKACAVGEIGQVLITTLHNFVTPLVRYEVGDLAEFGEPCSCGRGLPVIRKIHGRYRNRLMLPDGQSQFPYLGEHGDIARLTGVEVRQFQCIQRSLDEIELKFVLERPFNLAEQAKVAKLMQEHLGYPFTMLFSFLDDIPRGPTGKFEEFMNTIS